MIEHLKHVEQALRLEIKPKSVLELKFILDEPSRQSLF